MSVVEGGEQERDARRRAQLTDTMRAFAEAASDALALTREIAQRTAMALAGYCAVKIVSEDRLWLLPAASALPPTASTEDRDLLDQLSRSGMPVRVDGPHPLAQAVARAEPMVIALTDAHLRARFPGEVEYAAACRLGIHSALFVPIRLRGRTFGGMSLLRYGAAAAFTEADLRFVQRIADQATPTLANARLFGDAEREIAHRVRMEARQRALGAFARELAALASEPNAVVELTARRLAELVGDSCSIRLIGARRKLATAAIISDGAGDLHAAVAAFPQRPETTLSDRVAATGKSLLIPAVDAHGAAPEIDAALQPLLARLGVRSILVVPLVTGGEVLGVASLGRTDADRPYTDDDRELVEEAARHAALAIGNALLLDETKTELAERTRMQQRLRVLSELAKELADAATDLPSLLELVARRLTGLLGDMCFIRFVADDGTRFTDGDIFFHPAREVAREILALLAATTRSIPGSFGAPVVESNRTLRLANPDPEAFCALIAEAGRPFARRLGIRSMIGVPLVARGKVVGAIGVCRSRTAEPYTDDDMRLVEDIAAHASVAITNARLFAARLEELGKRAQLAERLRVVSESSRDFASATGDSRRLMALVAQRFGEVIGEAVMIRLVSEDGKALESTASLYHAKPEMSAAAEEALRGMAQRAGEGFGGQVLLTGQPVVTTGTTEELEARVPPAFAPLLRALAVTSFMSAPLLTRGKVIAVITLARSNAVPPYGADDIEFVSELATHAALAIHNSRLLESMQRELLERRRAEETLKRTEAQFRQAQKMEAVGRLAGGVAHDFNNLLTVILSSAEVLLEDIPIGDAMREDVDQIAHAGRRAADLTRQLLAFSRQQVLEPKLLDLNEVVGEMQKMIPRVVGEDIVVRVQLGTTLGIIKADPGLLGQVIMNLVVNARDAMPAGGILTIETGEVHLAHPRVRDQFEVPAGAYVVLAVGDTGMGMEPATLERIFEPFFTTKEQGKGTGLGLSTVFGIVEQSGGRVWVDSTPGRGTTFRIFLPRSAEQPVAPKSTGAIRPLRGGETILLVEDDDQVRAIARIILQRNGYQVLVARSGPDALQLIEDVPSFDLLLTDVVMPRMSGPDLATALVAARPKLRVLYMSGYTDEAILHHRVLEPGIALLQKPFTPESLLRRVRDVLGAP